MRFIGDVHGKVSQYAKLLQGPSIQVGDLGFKRAHEWHRDNVDPEIHKVVFGNHDYYPMLNEAYSLGDFSVLPDGIMTIRGAMTVDKSGMKAEVVLNMHGEPILKENGEPETTLVFYKRNEGEDLFSDQEELSTSKCEQVLDAFDEHRPSIVVSHDCPTEIRNMVIGKGRTPHKTITDQLLQGCFEMHQPDIWIFGHYHHSWSETVNGTKFVCLAELETLDI